MSFLLGTLSYSGWEQLKPWLTHLGWQPVAPLQFCRSDNSPELDLTKQAVENKPVLVLTRSPEAAIAEALTAGATPEHALQQWQQEHQNLLQWLIKNRRYATLVDTDAVVYCLANQDHNALLPLYQRLHLNDAHIRSTDSVETQKTDPLALLTAAYLLQQACACPDSPYQTMLTELDASTLPLNITAGHPDQAAINLNDFWALQQQQQQTQAETIQQLAEVQEENTLLLQQLHLVQEELEQQVKIRQQQDDAAKAAQQQLDTLKQQLAQTEQQAKDQQIQAEQRYKTATAQHQQQQADLTEENDLLLQQLHLVQEELERQFNAHNKPAVSAPITHHDTAEWHTLQTQAAELEQLKKGILYQWLQGPALKKQQKRRWQRKAQQLKKSPLFDAQWYLQTYPDVAEKKTDPALHYIRFGAAEYRDPGPGFSTRWYLETYPDVAESGINPLLHYMEHGSKENRPPKPD